MGCGLIRSKMADLVRVRATWAVGLIRSKMADTG